MPIQYRSTRSESPTCRFEDALLQGLAPDGGLYIPTSIPSLPESAWNSPASFHEMAAEVLKHWLDGDVDAASVAAFAEEAYNFPVPVMPLHGEGWDDVYVLECFHGPTLSFKDFGGRTMSRLMSHFLQQRGTSLTILVATSGDTGSAVADGFAGVPGIEVVLLYPQGQVSPTQERQLIVERPNVRSFAVQGTFDDCQRMVKAAFVDPALAGYNLSSANSINIGRLLPQMLYYIWAIRTIGTSAIACVPSGNLGNLTGGYLAKAGGVPIKQFIAAHNANDFFPNYLAGTPREAGPSVRTASNAMDVGVPSNFERLTALMPDATLRATIWGTSVDDAQTIARMQSVRSATGYVADPHTAVGLEAVQRYRTATGDHTPIFVLATAHPAKFPEVVEPALGQAAETPPRLAEYWNRPTQVQPLAPTLDALRDALLASPMKA